MTITQEAAQDRTTTQDEPPLEPLVRIPVIPLPTSPRSWCLFWWAYHPPQNEGRNPWIVMWVWRVLIGSSHQSTFTWTNGVSWLSLLASSPDRLLHGVRVSRTPILSRSLVHLFFLSCFFFLVVSLVVSRGIKSLETFRLSLKMTSFGGEIVFACQRSHQLLTLQFSFLPGRFSIDLLFTFLHLRTDKDIEEIRLLCPQYFTVYAPQYWSWTL